MFTARIQRMGEGNIFTFCVSPHLDGGGGGGGGTTSQVRVGGYPISGLGSGGYPIPGLARGGTPSQVWLGGWGTPGQTWDGVPPGPGTGYPPDMGWGTPPGPEMRYPPRQISIASTCYTAGGMPLVFMQEDFLQGSHFFPLMNSLTFPVFLSFFPDFFSQDLKMQIIFIYDFK